MTSARSLIVALAFFSTTAGINAQTTTTTQTPAGAKQVVETMTLTGEVVSVDGNLLVVKLAPSGQHTFFSVAPGREFMIDGQRRLISDLKPGVVLTATATTTAQPMTERTTTVTNGTVWFVSGNYVILTLESGENRGYSVPPSFQFVVNGKPASVNDLRKGMRVSATKIVEQPRTEVATTTVITGKSPKP